MASSTEPIIQKKEGEEDDSNPPPPPPAEDGDTGAQVAPIIGLQEVAVTTGEENEDVLLDLKSKLYRFDKEGNQWKERGVGTLKLLKHKESGKFRLVMRQNKTLKICANHLVLPTMTVQEHHGNDKSCVWHAADYADGELKDETFCIRFASVENCKIFKEKIEEITKSLAKDSGDSDEATAAANLLENLSVESKDQDEKPDFKEAPVSAEGKNDENKQQEKSGEEK
ncbi:Ran-binding protein 1-like protein c [Forsythia ovata]|uniref:Ran-binding protein 1-like protein c n=1 Tax=Forsythia ovata TaxID=205694 RepID=A0ABD1WG46_9LAMI